MFHLYRKKSIIFFITIVNSLKLAKGSLQPIVLPSLSEPKSSNVYEFTPLATIIGFAFIAYDVNRGISYGFIAILLSLVICKNIR